MLQFDGRVILRAYKILLFALLCMGSGFAWGVSPPTAPSTSNGNYTVAFNYEPQYFISYLEEKVGNSGTWTPVQDSITTNVVNFTNKPSGVYYYRVVALTIDLGDLVCGPVECSGGGSGSTEYYYSSAVSVTVSSGPPPEYDNILDQLSYQYQIRRGDVNGDGRSDIFIERTDGDPNNGVLYQTILTQNSDGTLSPLQASAGQLSNARSWASISPEIYSEDFNHDGFADLAFDNLSSISGFASVDPQMIYSSGVPYQGQATKIIDYSESVRAFLKDVYGYAEEGQTYLDQFLITVTVPVYGYITYSCTYYDPYYDDYVWGICWYYGVVGYTTVTGYDGTRLNEDAYNFIAAYESGRDDVAARAEANNEMSNILNQFGLSFTGNYDVYPYNDGAYRGEDHELVDATIFGMILDGPTVLWDFVRDNDALYDGYLNTDPNTWVHHEYGLESKICSTTQDTSIIPNPSSNNPIPGGVIPKEVCTLQNVFCWATKQPAPRADRSDESRATNGGTEVLRGDPRPDTDPITTWVDDDNYQYRNETQPTHVLHDPQAQPDCADFAGAASRDDIPARCAYVERQVLNNNGVIDISTHGEGYNHPEIVPINELGGIRIFRDVDEWVREKLAKEGQCTN